MSVSYGYPNKPACIKVFLSVSVCNSTVLVPRASLFTGISTTNGVLESTWCKTWVSELANSGYYCVNIGKMHTIPYNSNAGFHERFVVEN